MNACMHGPAASSCQVAIARKSKIRVQTKLWKVLLPSSEAFGVPANKFYQDLFITCHHKSKKAHYHSFSSRAHLQAQSRLQTIGTNGLLSKHVERERNKAQLNTGECQ